MKPFDLEAAKRGEPLITRDGRPAKFVAFVPELHQPLVILRERNLNTYSESGHASLRYTNGTQRETCVDLFMAPRKIVKWANIYRKGDNGVERVYALWPTEECAKAQRPAMTEEPFVAMARVEWEE